MNPATDDGGIAVIEYRVIFALFLGPFTLAKGFVPSWIRQYTIAKNILRHLKLPFLNSPADEGKKKKKKKGGICVNISLYTV